MNSSISLRTLLAFLSVSAIIFSGCATIVGRASDEVLKIKSTPESATVVIEDEDGAKVFEGTTPASVPLDKKKGYFSGKSYTVTISKTGFTKKVIAIDTKPNSWYIAGNFVFGGLIGWIIIDPATGAMWKLSKDKIDVTLDADKTGMNGDITQPRIVLLNEVPQSLRDKMEKISD